MNSDRNSIWGFSTAGRVFFGWGAVAELRNVAEKIGRRAFVCTDRNMVEAGICETALGFLRDGGAEIKLFDQGRPEIDRALIEDVSALAKSYAPDVVIGLGGGSNIDLSKAVALLVKLPGPLSDYYGESKVPGPILPIVAVPTTSGTGSEVSPAAVIADPDRAMKVGIASRELIPRWAVVDPALTVSCPASITAYSGMDALTHAIEAFTNGIRSNLSYDSIFVGKNPISDALAARAIFLVAKSLPTAVVEPHNRAAREDMALASLLAGMAFSCAGTATAHALQYPIGEATHTAHGLGNAVLLPTVMRNILPVRIEELAFIARCFNPKLSVDSDQVAASKAPALVEMFAESLGIPKGLRSLGLRREDLPKLSELAATVQRLLANSPVFFDQEGLLRILEEAF